MVFAWMEFLPLRYRSMFARQINIAANQIIVVVIGVAVVISGDERHLLLLSTC